MGSIFSKIANREIPAHIVAEEGGCLAFLDINPLAIGHVLAIPKKETDYYFDLADQEFSELNLFAKKVAIAIEKAIPCERIGVAVVGLEIPHVHIHLIPLNSMADFDFGKPKLKLSEEELKNTAEKIRKAYQR